MSFAKVTLSRGEAAVIGAACVVPGADSLEAFWSMLVEGRNAISAAPRGRWNVERFLRPGQPAPGFAYTFAGGYIEDPFQFDPAPFGISPREAQQIDPQQRLLLELVWRAFEDAGAPLSQVQGRNVGVYVGASSVDYQGYALYDISAVESHFMAGNSLSILANRVSHAFDLRGPSVTVDTACSSSFAALAQALAALRAGEVEMAVVAGVNMLLSPMPFVGFSQARMLSPTGLSRPFSRLADGYVRAEGGVALLLRRLEDVTGRPERTRAVIMGAGVNADGRTSGISLPSPDGQRRVIETLYGDLGVDPDDLAFVEAHGTGTPVGDPVEAAAIGEALARRRAAPLPIGSVKSNVGHLESASGLVGLLKAAMALDRGVLPRSLFSEELNPAIDFAGLNLSVAREPLRLGKAGRVAGVCNYGFGGVNAHVVLRAPDAGSRRPAPAAPGAARILLVSAATREALRARAGQFAQAIADGRDAGEIASALGSQQDPMTHRLALPLAGGDVVRRLEAVARDDFAAAPVAAATAGAQAPVFVFSGNGAQFAGMGRGAYLASADFREEIEAIDALFAPEAGWSLARCFAEGVETERLAATSVAQPLLYALQSALAAVLMRLGVRPGAVIGHSVGEVAAAEVCGALTRADAVRLVRERSNAQEGARGLGRMMVAGAAPDRVAAEIEAVCAGEVEITAYNGPASTTIAGPADRLSQLAASLRQQRIATAQLDIDYPFHTSALDPLRATILDRLAGLRPRAGSIAFLSTVEGAAIAGEELGAAYWWRNLRETVRFEQSVAAALGSGARLFVEIGPRPALVSAMTDAFRARGVGAKALCALSHKDEEGCDPCMEAVARLIANGAMVDPRTAFGPPPAEPVALPSYPFQRTRHVLDSTSEALRAYGGMFGAPPRHPLLGARMVEGSTEWRSLIDPALTPYLDDHRVDGAVVVPAAGLLEMALAAGADVFGPVPLEVDEFDIVKALAIAPGETREVATRFAEATGVIEIRTRRRFADDDWSLHARGLLRRAPQAPPDFVAPRIEAPIIDEAEAIYAEARRAGLEYGPLFRLAERIERDATVGVGRIAAPIGGLGAFPDRHVLHPASLDAAFHGLFLTRPQRDGETKAHLPVRFRRVRVWAHGATVRQGVTRLIRESDRSSAFSVTLLDGDGVMVVSIEAVVLRAVVLSRASVGERTFVNNPVLLEPFDGAQALAAVRAALAAPASAPRAWLLLRAFAASLAHRLSGEVLREAGAVSLDAARDRLPAAAQPYFDALLGALSERGGLRDDEGGSQRLADIDLPTPDALLATLLRSCPEAALEAQMAAAAMEQAPRLLRDGAFLDAPALARHWDVASCRGQAATTRLHAALEAAAAAAGRRLRVLAMEPFGGALMRALEPLSDRIDVTFAAGGAEPLDACRRAAPADLACGFLDLSRGRDDARFEARFDALVGVLHIEPERGWSASLASGLDRLVDGAPVILVAPGTEPTLDVLRGVWVDWLEPLAAGFAAGRAPAAEALAVFLRANGAGGVEAIPAGDGLGHVVIGSAGGRAQTSPGAKVVAIASTRSDLAAHGLEGALLLRPQDVARQPDETAGSLTDGPQDIFILPAREEGSATERLARRIESIRATLDHAAAQPARVVVVTRGALAGACPVEAGVHAFARVAINEFHGVDLRVVDIAPGLEAAALRAALDKAPGEREIAVTAAGVAASRIMRNAFRDGPLAESERSVLQFGFPGRVESAEWARRPRRAPGRGEIEIEVAAVGLNFRDVLVGLGVLDDDLLSAGLTGAALGFECAGIVARVGAGVTRLAPGDRVMGFAAGALASHLTAQESQFFAAGEGLTLEAAATIPVAFATAWHSLVERAGLRAGETLLAHGGAGGLGMAAIQIGRLIGARVIATAGNPARRAIARLAGADLVFDSRGGRFAEEIAASVGGVDVALNSLAGPAMVETFRLVKPFGRFIEAGKRDYLDNTHLGLRPFLRNITYACVDLDELLGADPGAGPRIMDALAGPFARGELKPLPHQVFEAHELSHAFRTMQASEHVGKIIVRPPRRARLDISARSHAVRPGVYLVVGGASGFGFATAEWLARRGATTLVLASRRGRLDEACVTQAEALRNAGVQVLVEKLDVADAAAVDALVTRIAVHGPLRGIVHAAAQLDDGLITSLEADRLRAALRAKVEGAHNLAAAARRCKPDFFALYSSATTLIGNPGQGAYVAANGYLEGLARLLRSEGVHALAIGWGAIADTGMVARDAATSERLRRATGVGGVKSADALAFLGSVLAMGAAAEPVHHYASVSPSAAAQKLPLLASPMFAPLDLTARERWDEAGEDLFAAVAGKPEAEALDIVLQALRREIAHILRMEEGQIDVHRPLAEMGFDSLMALELQMSVERLSRLQLPMVGTADRTLAGLAGAVLQQVRELSSAPVEAGDAQAQIIDLARRHTETGARPEEARQAGELLKAKRTR